MATAVAPCNTIYTVEGVDWRQAWVERNARRADPGDSAYWDGRSAEFKHHAGHSSYAQTFINYLAPEPGWSVLDVGCGSGTLALPLACDGHSILACDFSEGMLSAANEAAAAQGVSGLVRTQKVAWDDDWEQAGIGAKCVDVAIASRSTMVADLGAALGKLDRAARCKVAVTMATEYGPKGHKQQGALVDGVPYVPDYVYGVNLLIAMGAYPELRYIDSYKPGADGGRQLIRWAYLAWTPVSQA
jgi:SAM-dependent methyltransferase